MFANVPSEDVNVITQPTQSEHTVDNPSPPKDPPVSTLGNDSDHLSNEAETSNLVQRPFPHVDFKPIRSATKADTSHCVLQPPMPPLDSNQPSLATNKSGKVGSKRKYCRSKKLPVPKSTKKRSKLENSKKKVCGVDRMETCSMTSKTTSAVRALKHALMKESCVVADVMMKDYPWFDRITPEDKEKSDDRKRVEKLLARRQNRHAKFCIGAHVYSNHESVVAELPNVPIVKGHRCRRGNVDGRIVKQSCMDSYVWLVMFDNGKNIVLHEKYMTFKSRVAPSHLLGRDEDNMLKVIEAQKKENKQRDEVVCTILDTPAPVIGDYRKGVKVEDIETYFKPKYPWLTSDLLRKYAILHETDLSDNQYTWYDCVKKTLIEEERKCFSTAKATTSRKKAKVCTDKIKHQTKVMKTQTRDNDDNNDHKHDPSKEPNDVPTETKNQDSNVKKDSMLDQSSTKPSELSADVPSKPTNCPTPTECNNKPPLSECKPISSRGWLPSITTAEKEEIDNPLKQGEHRFYGPFNLDNLNCSQYNNLKGAEIVTGFKQDIVYTSSFDDGKSYGICMKISKSEFKKNKDKNCEYHICVLNVYISTVNHQFVSLFGYVSPNSNNRSFNIKQHY